MTEHLTTNDIDVLIHCYGNNEPHPYCNAPAVAQSLRMFERRGVIEPVSGGKGYRTTDKGKKWVAMLCATPEPVQQWADPREDDDD